MAPLLLLLQRYDRTLSGLLGGKRLGVGGLQGEATLEQQQPDLLGGGDAALTRGFSTPPPTQEVRGSGALWLCLTEGRRLHRPLAV